MTFIRILLSKLLNKQFNCS